MAAAAASSPSYPSTYRPTSLHGPSAPPGPANSNRPRPSFPVHPFPQATVSSSGQVSTNAFKAPAHKHAHHLHSIPPREKSTRTLIIDHLLWVHARTRLQQARTELGMPLSGPEIAECTQSGAPPKQAEDQDLDLLSDGENVETLKFRVKDRLRDVRAPVEDEYLGNQNLPLTHALRLRADGVERVLTAMLDQPPEVQPPYSDEDTPRTPPAIHGTGDHHFPNGVRLRLALSTLINDLFARDVPTPVSPASSNTPVARPRPTSTPSTSPIMSTLQRMQPPSAFSLNGDRDGDNDNDLLSNGLPAALLSLCSISSYPMRSSPAWDSDANFPTGRPFEEIASGPTLPSFSSFARSSSNPITDRDILPPILSHTSPHDGSQPTMSPNPAPNSPTLIRRNPSQSPRNASQSPRNPAQSPRNPIESPRNTAHFPVNPSQSPVLITQALRAVRPTERVLQLWKAGADPMTANSPPSLRCPRHLHHSCVICAAVKSPPLPTVSNTHHPGRASTMLATRGAIVLGNNGKSKISVLGAAPPGTGVASWKTGAGIGAGLSKPGIAGSALLRRTISHHTISHHSLRDSGPCASGGKLADLIPRFLRLSALVAVELGREAFEKEEEGAGMQQEGDGSGEQGLERAEQGSEFGGHRPRASSVATSPAPQTSSTTKAPVSTAAEMLAVSFRPTREWYSILCGLLTRGVLEGYLSRGWKGPQGMECLLGVGVGLDLSVLPTESRKPENNKDEADEDEFAQIDPDDFPSLVDAARILFPENGLVGNQEREASSAEADYQAEMVERLTEFLTVHALTPDLSTHLEDLAYKFPAEPVERAAVRFCEAVTRWRGKPELESYRKKVQPSGDQNSRSLAPVGPVMGGGVDNTFTPGEGPRKAPIEKYFYLHPTSTSPRINRNKRPRSRTRGVDAGEPDWGNPAKRSNFDMAGGGGHAAYSPSGTRKVAFQSGLDASADSIL